MNFCYNVFVEKIILEKNSFTLDHNRLWNGVKFVSLLLCNSMQPISTGRHTIMIY